MWSPHAISVVHLLWVLQLRCSLFNDQMFVYPYKSQYLVKGVLRSGKQIGSNSIIYYSKEIRHCYTRPLLRTFDGDVKKVGVFVKEKVHKQH